MGRETEAQLFRHLMRRGGPAPAGQFLWSPSPLPSPGCPEGVEPFVKPCLKQRSCCLVTSPSPGSYLWLALGLTWLVTGCFFPAGMRLEIRLGKESPGSLPRGCCRQWVLKSDSPGIEQALPLFSCEAVIILCANLTGSAGCPDSSRLGLELSH